METSIHYESIIRPRHKTHAIHIAAWVPSLERRMTSILQAFDTERKQQAALPLALIRPGRKDHPLQASCR